MQSAHARQDIRFGRGVIELDLNVVRLEQNLFHIVELALKLVNQCFELQTFNHLFADLAVLILVHLIHFLTLNQSLFVRALMK
mgnify:CR=1 FL=1